MVCFSIEYTNLFQPQKITVYNWNILQYFTKKNNQQKGLNG